MQVAGKSKIFDEDTGPSRRDWRVRALWIGHTAEVRNEPNRWSKSEEWRPTDHGKSNRPPETHDIAPRVLGIGKKKCVETGDDRLRRAI